MSKDPLQVSLQINRFGSTVAPRGGYIEGLVTDGPSLGKTALVRLKPDEYDVLLSRPEIAPHLRAHTGNEPVPVPDVANPDRLKLALRPVFEYPAGGGPKPMDQICASLPVASVRLIVDSSTPMPGMAKDPDRIVGQAQDGVHFSAGPSPDFSGGTSPAPPRP